MSKKVKVGVIVTSWWADLMYLPSFNSHDSAEVVALCGRNTERAESIAKKYGIPKVYSDYQQLITDSDVDAVVISTPDDLHYDMAIAALIAGKHVLCEKPLASNAGQAREMYEMAESAGVKHMVLFTWRWQPHFQYLKSLIDNGYLGRCYHVYLNFLGGYGRESTYAWRFDNDRANGILGDLGAHLIDFARWYIGDVVAVSANLATYVERPGSDGNKVIPANDHAFITLQFLNGAQAMLDASAVAYRANRETEMNMEFHGEAGTLQANLTFGGPNAGAMIRGVRQGEEAFQTLSVPPEYSPEPDPANFLNPYMKHSIGPRLFVDAILENHSISPSFYDGYKVQEIIDASIASSHSRAWVSIS